MIVYENRIESSFHAVDLAVMDILGALNTKCPHISKQRLFKINFMLRELLNNAVEHGNGFNVEKEVYCLVEYDSNSLRFEISDEGSGIDMKAQSADRGIKTRNRGYETISAMDFTYTIQENTVYVTFDLDKEE